MNDTRRKALGDIGIELESIKGRLEILASEEQDAFDAMPEGFQCADRGQRVEAAASELEDAVDALDTAIGAIVDASV